jgi:membrane associated rhomboid family serine protease
VLLGLAGCLLWRTSLISLDHLVVFGKPSHQWWRLLTAPFVYNNTGFAFVTLAPIAVYGWLLERRHGPLSVIAVFAVGAVGGMAVTAAAHPFPVALGGNGGALALIVAWAIPDLLELRKGADIDGDVIGTAVFAVVVALMPLAVTQASWIADAVGAATGVATGLPLARVGER